jgi:hypothetical protein
MIYRKRRNETEEERDEKKKCRYFVMHVDEEACE